MRVERSEKVHIFKVVDRGTPPTTTRGLIELACNMERAVEVFAPSPFHLGALAISFLHDQSALTGLFKCKEPATSSGVFHRWQVFL